MLNYKCDNVVGGIMIYYIDQKVFSIKDSIKITDENDNPQFFVKGKLHSFEIGKKLTILDANGTEIAKIKQKLFKIFPEYHIFENENLLYKVKKRIKFFGIKTIVKDKDNNQVLLIKTKKNIFSMSFYQLNDNKEVARINKKFKIVKDKYTLEILDNSVFANKYFIMFTIAIDAIYHSNKSRD